jgi:cytochrome P450
MDPAIQAAPYPYYAALREQAPVYWMPEIEAFVVSRYRDIQNVFEHPELYSIDLVGKAGSSMFQHAEARALLEREGFARNTKLSTDPPEHAGYRAIVAETFTAGRVRSLEPFVEGVIAELADALPPGEACDFLGDFASPLPVRVITRVLGLPESDADQIKRWSDAWVEPLSYALTLERELEVARLGLELQQYLAERFEELRRSPGDDLLSDIVRGRLPDGRPLAAGDAMGLAEHVLVGGHETVTSALASGLVLLIAHPDIEAALRADPSRVRAFVEESLRLESPSQGFFRYALEDSELAGVAIPKGSMVHLRFGAANRDPEQFADPDVLRLDRPNIGAHMAFGQGRHHCLGAPLARLELQLAFRALLARFERISLVRGQTLRHLPGLSLRTLASLEARFEPAAPV